MEMMHSKYRPITDLLNSEDFLNQEDMTVIATLFSSTALFGMPPPPRNRETQLLSEPILSSAEVP